MFELRFQKPREGADQIRAFARLDPACYALPVLIAQITHDEMPWVRESLFQEMLNYATTQKEYLEPQAMAGIADNVGMASPLLARLDPVWQTVPAASVMTWPSNDMTIQQARDLAVEVENAAQIRQVPTSHQAWAEFMFRLHTRQDIFERIDVDEAFRGQDRIRARNLALYREMRAQYFAAYFELLAGWSETARKEIEWSLDYDPASREQREFQARLLVPAARSASLFAGVTGTKLKDTLGRFEVTATVSGAPLSVDEIVARVLAYNEVQSRMAAAATYLEMGVSIPSLPAFWTPSFSVGPKIVLANPRRASSAMEIGDGALRVTHLSQYLNGDLETYAVEWHESNTTTMAGAPLTNDVYIDGVRRIPATYAETARAQVVGPQHPTPTHIGGFDMIRQHLQASEAATLDLLVARGYFPAGTTPTVQAARQITNYLIDREYTAHTVAYSLPGPFIRAVNYHRHGQPLDVASARALLGIRGIYIRDVGEVDLSHTVAVPRFTRKQA